MAEPQERARVREKCRPGTGCWGTGFAGWSNVDGIIRCDCAEGEKHKAFYPTLGQLAAGGA